MRLLHLAFDLPLLSRDIASFRAAVARAAGYEQDLMHNHRADGSVQYRYPLVQYRSKGGLAAIVGLAAGADAIYDWYHASDNRLLWNDQVHTLRLHSIDVSTFPLRYHEGMTSYRLTQWLALNERHYHNWQQLPDEAARNAELERLLVAHILTFCRAVHWRLPERLEVALEGPYSMHRTRFLGVNLMAFEVHFQCNLRLPHAIGLGNGVSHGFGVCRPVPGG
jgi:hypothetical protein